MKYYITFIYIVAVLYSKNDIACNSDFDFITEEAELDNLAEDSDSIFEEDDDNKADEGISINCPSDPGCATDRLESDGSILTRREIYCHMKSENKSESTEKMSTTSDHRDTRSHTPSMEQWHIDFDYQLSSIESSNFREGLIFVHVVVSIYIHTNEFMT